jgi:uncharacterized protein (TIGR03435 family)
MLIELHCGFVVVPLRRVRSRYCTLCTMTPWTTLALAAFLAQPAPQFEVVSVKHSTGCDNGGGRNGGGSETVSPDRLDLRCRTAAGLVQTAYGRELAISGGPAWMHSERYDIDAKAETPQSPSTLRGPMLQALLATRFQLQVHSETKEVPAYALTLGKGAPRLQPAHPGKCTPRGSPRAPGLFPCGVFAPSPAKDGVYMYSTTLTYFCAQLSVVMDRQVIDKTGIEGVFDIFIEASPRPADATATDNSLSGQLGSDILSAIQKMGLKLESAVGSRELLVIDHVERPSGN